MAFGDIIQAKTETVDGPTSVSVTLDSTPTEGNLLVAAHFTGAADSIAPTGFGEAFNLTDSGNSDQGALYWKVAGSGESSTVTATSNSGDENVLIVIEIEGPWESSPVDQTSTNGPTSVSSLSTGTTSTTSQDDEVAVAMLTKRSITAVSSWTNSFTQRGEITSSFKSATAATKLLSAAGTVETTASWTGAVVAMAGIATFKKQGVGGGRTTYNTDSFPLGLHTAIGRRINTP